MISHQPLQQNSNKLPGTSHKCLHDHGVLRVQQIGHWSGAEGLPDWPVLASHALIPETQGREARTALNVDTHEHGKFKQGQVNCEYSCSHPVMWTTHAVADQADNIHTCPNGLLKPLSPSYRGPNKKSSTPCTRYHHPCAKNHSRGQRAQKTIIIAVTHDSSPLQLTSLQYCQSRP